MLIPFRLALIPDRQVATERWPDLNTKISTDIVKRSCSWAFAVGDLTEWPRIPDWERVRASMQAIISRLTTCDGNHDFDKWDVWANTGDTSNRSLNNYNRFFPTSSIAGFVESMPNNRAGNTVQRATFGGINWVLIALNFAPTSAELTWLDQMLKKYADSPVILTAHAYLNGSSLSSEGEPIWNVIRRHKNVWMTLSGHFYPASGFLRQKTDSGSEVISMMADYQSYDAKDPNGYYGILDCDPNTRTISRTTYSPDLDRYMTGSRDKFEIHDVTFPEPSAPLEPGPGGSMRRYDGVQTNSTGEKIITLVEKIAVAIGLDDDFYVTSSIRSEPGSYHNGDRSFNGSPAVAVDFGFYDDPEANSIDDGQARDLARALIKYTRPHIVQLIHSTPFADDNGFYINDNVDVAGSVFGEPNFGVDGHVNHIHAVYTDASVDAALAQIDGLLAATPPVTPPSSPGTIPVNSFGVDYAFSRPSVSGLASNGVKFAFRYLSFDNNLTRPKILTNAEAKALNDAGIAVVSNYEWYPERSGEGFAAGAQDAGIALSQARAAGAPDGRPIYFSVDEDVSPESVLDYFRGVASKMPVSQIGVYGSYRMVKGLKEAGLVTWLWQTYAWSGNPTQWYPGNHVEQYKNTQPLAGGEVDFNRNKVTDFGQWFQGAVNPPPVVPPVPPPAYNPVGDRTTDTMVRDLWGQEMLESSTFVQGAKTLRTNRLIELGQKVDALTELVKKLLPKEPTE